MDEDKIEAIVDQVMDVLDDAIENLTLEGALEVLETCEEAVAARVLGIRDDIRREQDRS